MEVGLVIVIAVVSSIITSCISGYIVHSKIKNKYDFELKKQQIEFNKKLEEQEIKFNRLLEEERINNQKTTVETVKEFFTKPETVTTFLPVIIKGIQWFKK